MAVTLDQLSAPIKKLIIPGTSKVPGTSNVLSKISSYYRQLNIITMFQKRVTGKSLLEANAWGMNKLPCLPTWNLQIFSLLCQFKWFTQMKSGLAGKWCSVLQSTNAVIFTMITGQGRRTVPLRPYSGAVTREMKRLLTTQIQRPASRLDPQTLDYRLSRQEPSLQKNLQLPAHIHKASLSKLCTSRKRDWSQVGEWKGPKEARKRYGGCQEGKR